jgi:hypothetical protein
VPFALHGTWLNTIWRRNKNKSESNLRRARGPAQRRRAKGSPQHNRRRLREGSVGSSRRWTRRREKLGGDTYQVAVWPPPPSDLVEGRARRPAGVTAPDNQGMGRPAARAWVNAANRVQLPAPPVPAEGSDRQFWFVPAACCRRDFTGREPRLTPGRGGLPGE